MSTHRNIDRICIVVLVLTLLLTVAFLFGESLGIRAITDEDAESYTGTTYFTANDQDGSWNDNAYTTYITLDGADGTVDGNGAYFYDGDLVISNAGWYVITGTLEDGSIIVDAYDSSKVWIRLNGVSVQCSDDACLRVEQADKVFLTLAEGTESTLISGAAYSEEALADNTGGAIFSHDDLTINGSGSLTITAGYKHGIDVNDTLVITGGNIMITAPQDGIHVNDSFRFMEASLTIEAGDDAVHSDGELYIESGTVQIDTCYEGLEAITVDIAGGDITICSNDDGINANGSSGSMGVGGFGGGPMGAGQNGATETTDEEETYIRISGGTLTIINETGCDADGLDSNGSIYIDGGDIRISLLGDGTNNAIDYGSENGGSCIVSGGTLIACGGSGMLEEFSSNSTQCAVLYTLTSTVDAGTQFQILDADGQEILSYSPECKYSSVAFSAQALTVGASYTVCVGEETLELTLESTATTIGNTAGGGGMQPGGMKQDENRMDSEENSSEETDGTFPESPGGEDGERPERPEGEDGARPQMPEGEGGERPERPEGEGGERPERPEGENGERPQMPEGENGERPQMPEGENGEQMTPPSGDVEDGKMGDFRPGTVEADDAAASAGTGNALSDLDGKVWLLLGSSVVVLIIGILAAIKYRK